MAMPHKILRVFNTFKGLDTSSSDYERSPHHATTAQNLMLNDQGSLITRYGIQAHTTDATKQGFGILPYVNDAVPLIIQNTGIAATTDELITIGSEDIVRWYTDGSTNGILSTTSGDPIPRKLFEDPVEPAVVVEKYLGTNSLAANNSDGKNRGTYVRGVFDAYDEFHDAMAHWTISLWFRISGTDSGTLLFVGRGVWGGDGIEIAHNDYWSSIPGDLTVRFHGANVSPKTTVTGLNINDNLWHNVTITFIPGDEMPPAAGMLAGDITIGTDPLTCNCLVYVDGVLGTATNSAPGYGTASDWSVPDDIYSNNAYIGFDKLQLPEMDADFSHFSAFKIALTNSEINSIIGANSSPNDLSDVHYNYFLRCWFPLGAGYDTSNTSVRDTAIGSSAKFWDMSGKGKEALPLTAGSTGSSIKVIPSLSTTGWDQNDDPAAGIRYTRRLSSLLDKLNDISKVEINPSMDLLKNCVYITGVSSRGLLKYDGHMLQEASLLSTWDKADTDGDYSEPALPTVDTGTTNAKRFKSDVEANTISSSEKIRFKLIKNTGTVEAVGSTMGEPWYAWSSPSPSTTVQWRADNEGWHDIEIDMEFLDECFEYDWEAQATAAGITWGDYGTGGGNGGNNGIVDKTPSVDGDTNWLKVRYDNGSGIQYVELKALSTVYTSYNFLQIFVKKITVTDWAAKRGTITLSANLWGLFFGAWYFSNSSSYPTDYLASSGYLQWQSDAEIYLTFKNQNMLRSDEDVNTLLDFVPMPSTVDKNTINNSTITLVNASAGVSEEIPLASVERNYSAPGKYGGRLNFKDAAGNPKFIKMYGPWSNQNNLWTLDQKGPSAYRYLYQKVHKDAKGNMHYGTPSSQHLDDTENGSFRQDINLTYNSATGVDFNELSIPFENSATSNARGSLIIGGTTNKMYTLQCPSMPTYPVDTDAALTNNISCEIEVGDIVFAFNHGNTAGVGQCDEGVGGHTTRALCDAGAANHSDGATGHFNYLSREYRVLSKTDGGLIKSSGKTNGAGYTGSHDADNWKYWEIVVEPVVEGDPDWLFTGGADEFRAFTQFSGATRDAADWEMWASASNHRLLIYRTKNIWYPDINSYIADPTYYLVEEIPQPANSYDSFDIAGFTAKKTVQFRDYQSDSSLAASEPFIVPDKIPGAAPKKCTLSATYNNQLILSGDPDNPTTVYYSDYDAPENFPQGTNAFNVDEKVTAIKTVGQVLYIFQQNKIHMMSGDLIQDNFRVSQIASGPEIGTSSHHSLTEVEGALFFTNKNGVFAVKGNQVVEVSKLIKKTFTKLKDDLDKRWNRVSAYNWKERDIFVVYIPNKGVASGAGAFEAVNNGIEGADGSICLAYDYKRDAWFDWTVIRASGGFAFFNNKLYYTYLSEVDNSTGIPITGHLVSFEKTASGTLGDCEGISDLTTLTGIPVKYGTHWESLGDPATPKKFLRLKIYSADSDGYGQEWSSTSVNVKQQKDFTPTTIATKTGLMIWQSAKKWGMTKLNGTKCMSCRFLIEHTNTYNQPLVIKGIEIEVATPYKPGELKV